MHCHFPGLTLFESRLLFSGKCGGEEITVCGLIRGQLSDDKKHE